MPGTPDRQRSHMWLASGLTGEDCHERRSGGNGRPAGLVAHLQCQQQRLASATRHQGGCAGTPAPATPPDRPAVPPSSAPCSTPAARAGQLPPRRRADRARRRIVGAPWRLRRRRWPCAARTGGALALSTKALSNTSAQQQAAAPTVLFISGRPAFQGRAGRGRSAAAK